MVIWGGNDLIVIHTKTPGTTWLVYTRNNNILLFITPVLSNVDTIEDFYNSPYPVGSMYKYKSNNGASFWDKLGSRYESYSYDVEGAYEKLGNGTYSFFDSKQNLRYLMRSQFTNE